MPTLTPETRARLRELDEKATAGPVRCGSVKSVVISPSGEAIASYFIGSPDATEQEKIRWQADFDLAIESRNALPGLLADSDALALVTAERDRLREALQRMVEKCSECNGFGRLNVPDKTLTGRKSIPCNLCGQARVLLGGGK